MKGYKVTNAKRTKRVGLACCSLGDLIKKGCMKLSINHKSAQEVVVQLEDGTVVVDEEYFQTLPQHTLLFLSLPDEEIIDGAHIIYDALCKLNNELLHAGEESKLFFTDNVKAKLQCVSQLVAKQESQEKRLKSTRTEDPNWFEGVETNALTKEQFMFRRAQDRIRSYFYKTCEEIRKSSVYRTNGTVQGNLDNTIEMFRKELNSAKHFGSYFDRSVNSPQARLCQLDGEFSCQGRWDSACCSYTHHCINPYDSREARILFSTWNLDHRVERSRTVLPALLQAAQKAQELKCRVNWEYFFGLLFTTRNLRLVHIVCHDKGSHLLHCDPGLYTWGPGPQAPG